MGYAELSKTLLSDGTIAHVNTVNGFGDRGLAFIENEILFYTVNNGMLGLIERGILNSDSKLHLAGTPIFTLSGLSKKIQILEKIQSKNASVRDIKRLTGPAQTKSLEAIKGFENTQLQVSNLKQAVSTFQQALSDSHIVPTFIEAPIGAIDGTNKLFTTEGSKPYRPNSLILIKNRFVLDPSIDYTEINPSKGIFEMSVAPASSERLYILAYIQE